MVAFYNRARGKAKALLAHHPPVIATECAQKITPRGALLREAWGVYCTEGALPVALCQSVLVNLNRKRAHPTEFHKGSCILQGYQSSGF